MTIIELASGAARLAIDVERGGRVASWSIGGRELLVGPPAPDDRSIRWGCFLMAPWAGRLADGRLRTGDGRLVQVPRTHGRHAIHGLVWNRAWSVMEADRERAVLACNLPADLWPSGATVRQEVRLTGERLDVVATITAGPASMPAALGWHPWIRRDAGAHDDVALRVDASEVLRTDRLIPTGETEPVLGRTDLRSGPRLGRRRLDHAYVAARSPAVLRWRDLELTIAWDPSPSTLVVHTPTARLCIEPQTSWPNAPALEGDARERSGLQQLRPGESLTASMSMTARQSAAAVAG